MQKIVYAFIMLFAVACAGKKTGNNFTVKGVIEHNTGKMVYLEKIAPATMQPTLVDSAKITNNGSFILKSGAEESTIFNIRLDQNRYPMVSIINDAPTINLNIKLNQSSPEFAETYSVSGSPASGQLKDFILGFNKDAQNLFVSASQIDSLEKAKVADSVLAGYKKTHEAKGASLLEKYVQSIEKANNPALVLYELGYYQSTANGAGFGLPPISNDKVKELLNKAYESNKNHKGLAQIKNMLDKEIDKPSAKAKVGSPAPDFSLPDASGKMVSLSSFKGKYVLVDFWASWCGPCRMENPNVVEAYKRFKDKNFTILGVSLDKPDGKDQWLAAIMKDKLTWQQVSDLKYWESAVIPLYHIDGIPYNVLVDPNGIIVAEGLRGSMLMSKLEEVLK